MSKKISLHTLISFFYSQTKIRVYKTRVATNHINDHSLNVLKGALIQCGIRNRQNYKTIAEQNIFQFFQNKIFILSSTIFCIFPSITRPVNIQITGDITQRELGVTSYPSKILFTKQPERDLVEDHGKVGLKLLTDQLILSAGREKNFIDCRRQKY